jgi:ppGpp synthetase/RelA/SpoT-type nucleotidyltranferase
MIDSLPALRQDTCDNPFMCNAGEDADPTKADEFDFAAHRQAAVDSYRRVRGNYVDFAVTVQRLVSRALEAAKIKVHSIDQRAKTEESFGDKAARPSDEDSGSPKYTDPLTQIQDMAGCRVITFFVKDVEAVREVIDREFVVHEMKNRSSRLRGVGKPGYESYHFIVGMNTARLALPEYARYRGMIIEIQVRTILQHAWAEIEHDVQYKSVDALPSEIGQRFMALAGLIEIGDREFQAIADAHEEVRKAATVSLEAGRLEEVELTAEALKAYLDRRMGPDGRMASWSYDWSTGMLRRLGFTNLSELDECIRGYNDDHISRILWGSRQGQLSRLEPMLMAGMGPDQFVSRHPFSRSDGSEGWFEQKVRREGEKLRNAGIRIGNYTPSGQQTEPLDLN